MMNPDRLAPRRLNEYTSPEARQRMRVGNNSVWYAW